jgi:hypothetical protein
MNVEKYSMGVALEDSQRFLYSTTYLLSCFSMLSLFMLIIHTPLATYFLISEKTSSNMIQYVHESYQCLN